MKKNYSKAIEQAYLHLPFFRDQFMQELKCIYWSEKQLLKFLYRAGKASSTSYLRASFKGHCMATQEHLTRLERIFELLDEKKFARACDEMEFLIYDARNVIRTTEKNTLARDAGLIIVTQKIESAEIKKYNQLINLANELGNLELIHLLEETLVEELEAEETFEAVLEDTLKDELFKTVNPEQVDFPEEVEELEAV